ncbi:MAG: hypothetical protein JNL79_17675 [Myxococcales bacterium]|nr:hypothetical protein [Myxococcales bacterium]
MLPRATAFCLGLVVVIGGGRAAHAGRLQLDLSVDVGLEHMTTAPKSTFTMSEAEGMPRSVAGKDLRGGYGALTFLSVGGSMGVVWKQRYWFSLLGMRIGGAVGPYSPVLRSVDGSPAELRPARAWHVDVDAVGFRVRENVRRWSFGAGMTFGATILVTPATVGIGADAYEGSALAATFFLRGHLEVCRRVDPVARACLVVSPFVHQFRWFDGGALALRWEVSP